MSLGYLLSLDFEQLATQRTGKENPSFVDMKTGFWLSEDPIGANIICPRDGRPGCALVDWIPRDDRREQTHFLSWTWKDTLAEVASALTDVPTKHGRSLRCIRSILLHVLLYEQPVSDHSGRVQHW